MQQMQITTKPCCNGKLFFQYSKGLIQIKMNSAYLYTDYYFPVIYAKYS